MCFQVINFKLLSLVGQTLVLFASTGKSRPEHKIGYCRYGTVLNHQGDLLLEVGKPYDEFTVMVMLPAGWPSQISVDIPLNPFMRVMLLK